jgi:hypothetical protein
MIREPENLIASASLEFITSPDKGVPKFCGEYATDLRREDNQRHELH